MPPAQPPDAAGQSTRPLAAVVLNYRTPDATLQAVASLQRSDSPPSEIIVVDNASGDDSLDRLSRELPDVRLIAARTNGGFSAGCNLGIREGLRLNARTVLLLNSDALVMPDTIGRLERALADAQGVGIVGPMIVSAGDERIESLGITYSTASGRMRHRGQGLPRASVVPFDMVEVDAVSGCAMLIRREVFEAVGLLADEFFFGFEDVDFCLRARRAGLATACVGTSWTIHEGSLSVGRGSPRRTYFAARNHLLLASRVAHGDPAVARAARAATVIGLNLAHALFRADVPRLTGLRALVRGVRDHWAGRYGPPPHGHP